MKNYKAVLFDLDGTLMDTSPGISKGIDYMLPKMGLPPLSEEEKIKFIGPPLSESYSKFLGLSGKDMERAIDYYRDYCVNRGYKEYKRYSGMDKLLEELGKRGLLRGIVTMKKQSVAEQCVKESGYNKALDFVLGNNDLESVSKAGLIKQVLDRYGLNKDEVLLVGDTNVDAKGAYQSGIDYFPALFGFGYSHTGLDETYPYVNKLQTPLDLLDFVN